MAQKIKIDLDLQEIQDLVHDHLQAVGVQASSASASQLASLYRVAVQRLQTPFANTGSHYGYQIRNNQLYREIQERQDSVARQEEAARQRADAVRQKALDRRRKEEEAKEHPFLHALGGFHVGTGIAGGGIAGIGGSVVQFAKLLETASPALVGVTAGLALLGIAAVEAGSFLRELAQGALSTGSTPGGFAFAQTMGGLAGLDPKGTGGMLQGLRQQISTDPLAMAAAGQFGVRALPPGFGPVPDMGKIFEKLFTGMQGMTTAQKQHFAEQVPAMQPFLAAAEFGRPDQIQRVKQLAQAVGELGSQENVQRAFDLSLAQQELSLQWTQLATTLGTIVLPAVTNIVKGLGVLLDFSPEKKAFAAFAQGKIGEGFKDLAGGNDEKDAKDKHGNALKDHAAAMEGHTAELRLTRNGVFGGGSRAQGAIPAGLRGDALQRALDANAVRLGAF